MSTKNLSLADQFKFLQNLNESDGTDLSDKVSFESDIDYEEENTLKMGNIFSKGSRSKSEKSNSEVTKKASSFSYSDSRLINMQKEKVFTIKYLLHMHYILYY